MFDRRNFLSGSAAAATVAISGGADSQAKDPQKTIGNGLGYNYQLPQFESGSRLLFQGDSITDMAWGRNERDRNHYLGHSYVFLLASRLGVDMPGTKLDFYNRGMSGHTVADLRGRWQKDAIDMKPDLLSVLIGVNDVGHQKDGVNLVAWESDYRFILDASRKANSKLRLVLLEPFVLPSGQFSNPDVFARWREEVDRILPIVARLATDYDAVHIATQSIFNTASEAVSPAHWLWDGIHPLPQGHELIARSWLQKVSEKWGHATAMP